MYKVYTVGLKYAMLVAADSVEEAHAKGQTAIADFTGQGDDMVEIDYIEHIETL